MRMDEKKRRDEHRDRNRDIRSREELAYKGTTIICEEIGSTNTCFGYVDRKTCLVALI
jgi:hypothetical protein